MYPPSINRSRPGWTTELLGLTQTSLAHRDRGGVLAEYGLLIAMVFLAGITAVALFGDSLLNLFSDANEQYPTTPTTN